MGRPLLMLLIGLFFGAGLGVVFAAGQGLTLNGHDHFTHAHGDAAHAAMHEASVDVPGARVSVEATPDAVGGYNLHLVTGGFAFAPAAAGHAHVPGEGHAHVYVDGVKLGRLYGEWVHIPTGGDVRVTLNANDHRTLTADGQPVEARLHLD